ncbi:MAG: hypothetical protein ACRC2T_20410, partial [Thermoguttaceae bacterium]
NEVVLASGTAYLNRVKGFDVVTVNGSGIGNNATINGSAKGNDRYESNGASSTLNFAGGNVLNFNGFQNTTVNAGKGISTAVLSGGYNFAGYVDHCAYAGNGFQQTLNGFGSTVVEATSANKSIALLDVQAQNRASIRSAGNAIVLNVDDIDLYTVIAFDQVNARKAAGGPTGKIESATDFLFATGDWDAN